MTEDWFTKVENRLEDFQQGELLQGLELPSLLYPTKSSPAEIRQKALYQDLKGDFIILTQSCDMNSKNNKDTGTILLAPVTTTSDFGKTNKGVVNKGTFEDILKQKKIGYYALYPPHDFKMKTEMLVTSLMHVQAIDFEILRILVQHDTSSVFRYRLASPIVEDLSHRFGELHSRVANRIELFPPSAIELSNVDLFKKAQGTK